MPKVLIAYFSVSGITETMAEFIAEGVRFSGQEAVVKKVWNGNLYNGFYSYQFVYKNKIYEFYPGTPYSEWCID